MPLLQAEGELGPAARRLHGRGTLSRSGQRARGRSALAGSVRPLRRNPDGDPRWNHRQRRAAFYPERPRLHTVESRLGRQLVPDRVRRTPASLRAVGGPGGSEARPGRRPGRFHSGLAAVRVVGHARGAHRGAVRPGHRGRLELRRGPGNDRHDVSRPAGAGARVRGLQLRGLSRRVDRPARRRHSDPRDQLALDLLRKRAHRHRVDCSFRAAHRLRSGHRLEERSRRGRCSPRHCRSDAGRLHDCRDFAGRLGFGPDDRARRCIDPPAGRLCRATVDGQEPAVAASCFQTSQRLGRQSCRSDCRRA